MTKQNSEYEKCLDRMFGLRRFGIKLGLSTIRNILSGLGNPQDTFSAIHIAGTNGKGSIASALATILRLSGFRTGLYTSPHLIRFNERICVNGKQISDQEVLESFNAVNSVHRGSREPTFFEFTTAMAFYEFSRKKVQWAVIETGMGGRLDATNIIRPELSIISNISVEHKTYLGNTLAEISGEKAGIIKDNIPVISGVRQKNVIAVLEKAAKEHNAPFYRLGKDFKIRRNGEGAFSYFGMDNSMKGLRTSLPGRYQADNAGVVLAACEILGSLGVSIPESSIRKGLAQNIWPGRLEYVSRKPDIILDGAHNLEAAKNLKSFLSEQYGNGHIVLVIGILDDKPYEEMLRYLVPLCEKVIICRAKIDRSLPAEILSKTAAKYQDDIEVIPTVAEAVKYALKNASEEDVICIAGSLYVVGEAREELLRSGICRDTDENPSITA